MERSSFSSTHDACSDPRPTTQTQKLHLHHSLLWMCSTTLDSNTKWSSVTQDRQYSRYSEKRSPRSYTSMLVPSCTAPIPAASALPRDMLPASIHKTPKQTQSGIIIWSHDLSWRVQGKSYHADKVRIQRLEQQLHQQRLILLDELVTLQEGEHTLRPIHTEPFPTGMELSDF